MSEYKYARGMFSGGKGSLCALLKQEADCKRHHACRWSPKSKSCSRSGRGYSKAKMARLEKIGVQAYRPQKLRRSPKGSSGRAPSAWNVFYARYFAENHRQGVADAPMLMKRAAIEYKKLQR